MKFASSVMVCVLKCVFPEGKALSGEASPVFPGEWRKPAPRRRAGLSSGVVRKVGDLLGSARGLARKIFHLHGPLDRPGRRCHGAETSNVARSGPPCRVRKQPLDKRSLPGSAETGAGRLRALGIESGHRNGRWPSPDSVPVMNKGYVGRDVRHFVGRDVVEVW